jgi:hypothetical protein
MSTELRDGDYQPAQPQSASVSGQTSQMTTVGAQMKQKAGRTIALAQKGISGADSKLVPGSICLHVLVCMCACMYVCIYVCIHVGLFCVFSKYGQEDLKKYMRVRVCSVYVYMYVYLHLKTRCVFMYACV